MASGMQSELPVYLGVWTNWSRGPVLGATLTLTRFNSNLVIAFTSFFIALAGTRFWRIVCMILHRRYSDMNSQDGLHLQRQVILRNSHTTESGLLALTRLYWAWRGSSNPFLRTALPILLAAFFSVGFIIAGGFSASISTGIGHEVLLESSNCAVPLSVIGGKISSWDMVTPFLANLNHNIANYAQQCYKSNSSGVLDCTTFVTSTIPSKVNNTAACPFKNGICRSNDSNLFLESTINSNDHLGLNTPADEQIQAKTTLQCAPIITTGYRRNYSRPTANYTRYYYGDSVIGTRDNITMVNGTFTAESTSTQYAEAQRVFKDFILGNIQADVYNKTYMHTSSFIPIPDLQRKDSDMAIYFLVGNGVRFVSPTEDPWYQATTEGATISSISASGAQYSYYKDEAASPLACVERFQFCRGRPSSKDYKCGPLASYWDAFAGAAPLFGVEGTLNELMYTPFAANSTKEASQFFWYFWTWQQLVQNPSSIIQALGSTVLASREKYWPGLQGPVPNNQWQADVERLWNMSLASKQLGYVTTAIGVSRNPEYKPYSMFPKNSHQRNLCANQKIQSSRFGSFSLFGLCFTYVLGVLIVILSFSLEPLFGYCINRRQRKLDAEDGTGDTSMHAKSTYKHLEWVTNETLQQQRLAHEQAGWGSGTWKNCVDYVPTTQKGEVMGYLDLRDPKHPVLVRSKSELAEGFSSQESFGQESFMQGP